MKKLLLFIAVACLAGAPRGGAAQGYGESVAVAGADVLVGESTNERGPGAVYVYRNQDGAWVPVQRLVSSDAADGDHFGRAIGASGDQLLVGATVVDDTRGAVYIYERDASGAWVETGRITASDAQPGDAFGRSMAVHGNLALVSSWAHNEARGAVYVLARGDDGVWREEAKLTASDGRPDDRFGVGLSTDGTHALVGAPQRDQGAGAVYAYRRDADGGWSEIAVLEMSDGGPQAGFGSSVLTRHGMAMAGAPGAGGFVGAVQGYRWSEETGEWSEWATYRPFDGRRGTQFGTSLTADEENMSLWIGARGAGGFQGRAYVMTWDVEEDDWGAMSKVSVEGLAQGDRMGDVVALGSQVGVVGLPGDDWGVGTAAIIERTDSGWSRDTKVWSEVASLDAITGSEVRCEDGAASIWSCADVDIVSFLPVSAIGGARGVQVNDVWGWTDPATGKEWALVGRYDGTSFIDMSDPGNPVFVGDLPLHEGANPNVWRDIKVYEDHAFIVSDGAGAHGMQVFDLTQLRDVASPPVTFAETAHYDQIHSAHNIVINEETGFAYSVGSSGGGESCGGGLHMIDIRDPKNPSFAGCFADASTGRQGTGYSHDAMCIVYHGPDAEHEGKEICFGANETALSIADVTTKGEPVALAMASYPNVGYSHQGWIDAEHEYFYMNDELDELGGGVENTRTLVWDVKDLDDPILVTEYFSDNRSSDHNLYIRDNLMYQSNYVSGLRILDISDRENPEPVAFFDTVPWGEDAPGFDGSWSNYPYFESGVIVVTSGAEGVFLLRKASRKLIP
ncbi:MAG: choice-of-anchor B family protein [Gemmatimonadota bacterium]|nr:choice-of-anchor B family protein [Gemmatimonadota bacterium]